MAVLVKRSSVAGKVPLTTDLNYGELAVNTNDGRLFMKYNSGGGDVITEITSVTSLLNKAITGSVTLTALEYSKAMIVLTGALTANTVVTVPNTAHAFIVVNKTTGNYSLSIQAQGTSNLVNVTQGTAESLLCDTTGVYATASTTGVEFAKIVPVTANVTCDITHAGALLLVTTSGVTITLPAANTYQGGIGFGILNVSGGNISVVKSVGSSDTSPVGLPLTVKNNDSYYLASDNVSVWQCVWYSNPISPTFGSVTTQGTVSVGTNLTVGGTTTLNGATSQNGALTLSNAGPTLTFNAGGPQLSLPTANTLAFSNGSSEVFRITSNGRLLVGTTTDDGSSAQVSGDVSSQQGKFVSTRYATNGGALVLRNAAGSFGAATATQNATQSGTVTYRSYDGTNYQDNAAIEAWTEGVTSNTSSPGGLRFYTTPSSSITKSERMRITARGGVLIGTTTDDGASALIVTGTATFNNTVVAGSDITSNGGKVTGNNSAGALTASNGGGTGQTSIILKRTGAATDQKTWEFLQDGSGNLNIRTVNDAYSASTTALQVNRGAGIGVTTMTILPSGGRVLMNGATDDTSSALQVNGVISSQTGGFKFPDGTVQTTANGVTAPNSNVYTPVNGATSITTTGYVSPLVQVFKNNLRLIPNVDFTLPDGINIALTTAATGRDRYEVLTSVIYSPSAVFAPQSQTYNVTAGQSSFSAIYNPTCVWLFKNSMKMIPGIDFTATNGTSVSLTVASESTTDIYELVTFQPLAINGMLPLTGGTVTGPTTFSGLTTLSNVSQITMSDGYAMVLTPSGRNRIINGDCRVQQRGNGSYGTGTSGYSAVDMFNSNNSGAGGVFSQTAGTITYGGIARKAVVQTVTSTGASFATAGNLWLGIQTRMEGQDIFDMLGGTASLSFLFNTNVTGTYAVQLFDNTGNNSYVTTFTATANTPKRVTIPNIPFPATLGVPNNSNLGLLVTIGAITGTTYQTSTLNAWQTGNLISNSGVTNWSASNGNFIAATEIQFEPGSVVTPFERLSIAESFEECQRYLEICYLGGYQVYNQSATTSLLTMFFNTTKRVAPTLAAYSLSGATGENMIPVANITSINIDRGGTTHCQLGIAGSGGLGAGTSGRLIGTGVQYFMFSSEL